MNNYLNYNLKNVLFILFFTFIVFAANSQSDYRPAYIITLDNDTTYGWINYNGDVFDECQFKTLPEDKPTVFKPFEIISFRFIDDVYYVSKQVMLRNSYVRINQIQHSDGKQWGEIYASEYQEEGLYNQNFFLEYLLKGELNLYYLVDKKGIEHYFLEEYDSVLIDLTIEEIQTYHNSILYSTSKGDLYKGKMKAVMKASPEIYRKIDNIELSHNKLINITKEFHNSVCKDYECIIYKKNIIPRSIHFGFYGGMLMEHSKSLSFYKGYSKIDFTKGLSPAFGLYLHIKNPVSSLERFSIKFNTEISKSNYSSDYNNKYDRNNTSTFHYSAYSILISLTGNTRFSTIAYSPYIEYGFLSKYSFGESYDEELIFNESREYMYPLNIGATLGLGYEFLFSKKSKGIFVKASYRYFMYEYNFNGMIGFEF